MGIMIILLKYKKGDIKMLRERLERIIKDANRQKEVFGRVIVTSQSELLEAAESYLKLLNSSQTSQKNFNKRNKQL